MEEFRTERQIMLDFQKERQGVVDKLMDGKSFIKRLLWEWLMTKGIINKDKNSVGLI